MAFTQSLICGFIAVGITGNFDHIEGSGIPETKYVISGISIYKYMSLPTLFMKSIALIFAIGSGFFIGKEGPFIHLSACIAENLSKLSIFKRLHQKNTLRRQMLAIAAGVGVTATFGTPLGGCLYSVETVISFIAVNHVWKSLFCSCIAGIWLQIISQWVKKEVFKITEIAMLEINFREIFIYLIFGIMLGLIGALFVTSLKNVVLFKRYLLRIKVVNIYTYSIPILVLHILFYYFYSPFGIQDESLRIVFLETSYEQFGLQIEQSHTKLLFLTILRLILHVFALSCVIPSGNLVPLFFLGALIGRLFTPVAQYMGSTHSSTAFAVVGAATLVSSTIHATVAIIVITFEYTQQIKVLFPMLVSMGAGYIVASFFQTSLYKLLIHLKQLPLLPQLLNSNLYNKQAKDIMNTDIVFLQVNSNMADIAIILKKVENNNQKVIPVLSSSKTLLLRGTINVANLKEYLFSNFKEFKENQKEDKRVPDEINYNNVINNNTFWQTHIELHNPLLCYDQNPFVIPMQTTLPKLHFMFLMLGLQKAFVLDNNMLRGVIKIDDFHLKGQ